MRSFISSPARLSHPKLLRSRLPALLALAAAVMFLLLPAAPAEAQTVTTLVSNTVRQQSNIDDSDFGGKAFAQKFDTGPHAAGYALTSIGVALTGAPTSEQSATYRAELWSNSGNKPDSKLWDLTAPSSISSGLNTFTAPSGTTLSRNTDYHLVVYTTGDLSTAGVSRALADRENNGKAAGWNIGNNSNQTASNAPTGSSAWTQNGASLRIEVKGYVIVPTTLTLTTDATNNMVAESGGTVMVTATLDVAATSATPVTLSATSASTATATDDYTLPAAFTIAAGSKTATGTVTIVNDDIDEDNETIALTTTVSGVTVTNVTLTITDDDTSGVTVSQTSRTVEVGETTTYTVKLNSQPTANVTIAPTSGASDKATVTPASRVFTPSNWNNTSSFTVTGAATGTSTITHAATSADSDYNGATIGSVSVTVNASTKTVRIETTKTVDEGGAINLTVTLGRAAPTEGVLVAFTFKAVTTASFGIQPNGRSDDVTITQTSLNVLSGNTTGTLSGTAVQDALVEGDETFEVTVSTSKTGWAVVSGEDTATVTITDDDDDAATIALGSSATAAHTASVAEDVSGGTLNVPVTVSHLPAASTTFTVDVVASGSNRATEYVSAQNPGDYRIATKTVTFGPTGDKTKNISVAITDDDLVEEDQTISLRIADSGSTGLGQIYTRHSAGRTATLTIDDDDADDAKIALGSSAAATTAHTASKAENATPGSFTVPVTISHLPDSSTTFAIQVNSAGTTATSADYSIGTSSVTFTPTSSSMTQNITVSITNDALVEDDQTISLRIAAISSGLNGRYARHAMGSTATLTITDDERPTAKIALGGNAALTAEHAITVEENVSSGTAAVPVTVSNLPDSETTFTIDVLSAGTTATSADYSIATSSVTFTPTGSTTRNMTVTIANDALVEDDQVIKLRLADTSGNTDLGRHYARHAMGRTAALTITDDERPTAKVAFGTDAASVSAQSPSVDENVSGGILNVPLTISHLPESSTTFTVEVLETATRPATQYTDAANPGDYRVLDNKTLTFGPTGAKSKNVRVQLTNDALVEHPETVQLRVVAADTTPNDLGDHYVRHAQGRLATVTINDDDAAAAKIAIGSSATSTAKYTVSKDEDSGGLTIPITVSHAPSANTTFALEILPSGTATDGTDYSIPLKTILFTPAGTSDSVPVAFMDDDWVEDDQTIEVRIVAADETPNDLGDYYARDANGALGTITIEDDEQRDAKIAFGASATSTTQHTATGQEVVGTLNVPITINHLPESNTTFTVEVLEDSSTARETNADNHNPANDNHDPKDYGIATKSVTFGPTSAKSMNLTIAIANDTVEEDDEDIQLRIAAADTTVDDLGDYYGRHASGATSKVTLDSEDAVGRITLTADRPFGAGNSINVFEGQELEVTATANIPVGPGGWSVTFNIRAFGAITPVLADLDDVVLPAFTIPEGATKASGTVRIVKDSKTEQLEFLWIRATGQRNARNVVATPLNGLQVRISDSGAGATVSATELSVATGDSETYTIRLNQEPFGDVTVTPASSDTDKATVSGPLTFTSGNWETTQNVTVTGVANGTATVSHAVSSEIDEAYDGLTTLGTVAVTVREPVMDYSLLVKETGQATGTGVEGEDVELEVKLGTAAPTGGLAFTVTQTPAGTTPATVTVAEGEKTVSLNASIADNELVEAGSREYTISIAPTSATGWTANGASVTITFSDDEADDASIAFGSSATATAAHAASVDENVSGGTLDVPVVISHLPAEETTFNVSVIADSTATEGSECLDGNGDPTGADYTFATKSVTFGATGDSATTKNLSVTICDDDDVEPDETIRLAFEAAPATPATAKDIYQRMPAGSLQAVITIDSEDAPSTVQLLVGASQSGAGSEGGNVTVTATLDKPADTDGVTVTLSALTDATVQNPATADDYTLPDPFTIAAGETSATGIVSLLDDDEVDGSKTLRLTAATSPALTLEWSGSEQYLEVVIADTDSPDVTVSEGTVTVAAGQTAPYTVNLNTRPAASVTVTAASGDEALATVTPTTLTFTTQNWQEPQEARVQGVAEGSVTITHSVDSADPVYAAVTVADVQVTVQPSTTVEPEPPEEPPVAPTGPTLSGITLTAGGENVALSQTFAADVTAYTASVPHEVDRITVSAVSGSDADGVSITPADADASAGGHQVDLDVGANSISITVTAEDGTVGVYTITVTRAAGSDDATLSGITLTADGENVALSQTFAADVTAYSAGVSHAVERLTVSAAPVNAAASAAITPADTDANTEGHQVALAVGANSIAITVTAEDGTTTRTYTITVTRAEDSTPEPPDEPPTVSDDATLSGITLTADGENVALSQTFAADVTAYAAGVSHAVDRLTVSAEDGTTTRAYTIMVTRAEESTPEPPPGEDACVEAVVEDGTVNGTWAEGCQSAVDDRGYARYYSITLTRQSEVTIDLESEVDTYLYLRVGDALSGVPLHENDDVERSNLNSRITAVLDAGSYTIEATTYSAGQAGSFTLTVAGLDGTEPPPEPPPSGDEDACVDAVAEDGTVNGTWSEGCQSAEDERGYARYYSITLTRQSEVTIDLESEVDTYLYLRVGDARSGASLHENDDVERSNLNSRITAVLDAGSYTIEATTYSADRTGSFTLTVAGLGETEPSEEPSPGEDACVDAVAPGDGTVNGRWAEDCQSAVDDRGYARYYSITLSRQSEVTIDLESEVDTYLYLRVGDARSGAALHENDDVERSNLNSRITAVLEAGSYTIEATTYSAGRTGGFTLTVAGLGETEPPEDPSPGEDACIVFVAAEDGTVNETWTEDCESAVDDRGYARYYSITLSQRSEVTIDLESEVDTYLYLRVGDARSGEPLHENDDVETGNLNSRITATLDAGSYTIEATTYSAGQTGSFTLTVAGLDGTEPPPEPPPSEDACVEAVAEDGTVNETWTEDCESAVDDRGYARYYSITLSRQSEVTIDLESEVDTYLYLRVGDARSGAALHENDDVERSNLNSRITAVLDAGSYTIEATTYSVGQTGSFTLTVAGLGGTEPPQ